MRRFPITHLTPRGLLPEKRRSEAARPVSRHESCGQKAPAKKASRMRASPTAGTGSQKALQAPPNDRDRPGIDPAVHSGRSTSQLARLRIPSSPGSRRRCRDLRPRSRSLRGTSPPNRVTRSVAECSATRCSQRLLSRPLLPWRSHVDDELLFVASTRSADTTAAPMIGGVRYKDISPSSINERKGARQLVVKSKQPSYLV
jgi:hypothetical protein